MERNNKVEIVKTYFDAVCDVYRLGNVESSYNRPIMDLFTGIGCAARDLSGERKGQTGENSDGIMKMKLQKRSHLPELG